jgi:hypothetical protein
MAGEVLEVFAAKQGEGANKIAIFTRAC